MLPGEWANASQLCINSSVGCCLQLLFSSADVDKHDWHQTFVPRSRSLRVSVQILPSFA